MRWGRIGAALREQRLELQAAQPPDAVVGLTDWIPKNQRGFSRPYHLKPITDELERIAQGDEVRLAASAPPRHAKTETCCIGLAVWLLQQFPEWLITYATYGASLSYEKNIRARELARRVGIQPGRINTQALWTTKQGGGMRALGIGGPFIGKGTNVLLADDVFKDRVEAENPRQREKVRNWFTDVAMQRLEPGGSVVVFGARWHQDDLIGYLVNEGWKYINLPAVRDYVDAEHPEDGFALWPERWSRKALAAKEREVKPYGWSSLYQGNPRPRGANVYQNATVRTDGLPSRLTYGIGLDLAYSAKARSDWSIAVVMGREATKVIAGQGIPRPVFHIVKILRRQVSAPQFAAELKALHAQYRTAPLRWIASGTEIGTCDFLNDEGIPVEFVTAKGDKFVRAIPSAAAWNEGRITVANEKLSDEDRARGLTDYLPNVNEFLSVINGFTGVSDVHDDDVDALGAAHSLLETSDLAEALALGQL